jgi:hypothetical protein
MSREFQKKYEKKEKKEAVPKLQFLEQFPRQKRGN